MSWSLRSACYHIYYYIYIYITPIFARSCVINLPQMTPIVCIPDNSLIHQAIEVTGSSSATEVSAASDSAPPSSSHIPVPVQTEGSGRWCVPHLPHMSNNPREFG